MKRIKNGEIALKPVSVRIAALGGVLLIQQGVDFSWSNMTILRATRFGLVGLRSAAYLVSLYNSSTFFKMVYFGIFTLKKKFLGGKLT